MYLLYINNDIITNKNPIFYKINFLGRVAQKLIITESWSSMETFV